MRTIVLDPLIPSALWVALAAAAAILLFIYALRRPMGIRRWRWSVLIGAMIAAVACVLIVLLNPTWIEQIPPPGGRPRLIVLCDASLSMATPDAADHASRYSAAARVATDMAQRLGSTYDVQLERFSSSAAPSNAAQLAAAGPDGHTTDLAGVLSSLHQVNVEAQRAVVLLSDGIQTAGGGAASVLAAARTSKVLSAPIYTRTFGSTAQSRDVQIELRSTQELAYIEQQVPIEAVIRHVGLAGRRVSAALLLDGKEIERISSVLRLDDVSIVRFAAVQKKRGVYRYQVRLDAVPEEATPINNSASFLLRVIDEPMRLLLLEGKPYWDAKFLMRTLASDLSVDVEMRARLTGSRTLRRVLYRSKVGLATSPAAGPGAAAQRMELSDVVFKAADVLEDPRQLDAFQIVFLGRDVESFLTPTAVTNLRTWVARKGGSLVCFRGEPVDSEDPRITSLMPVRWVGGSESRFRVQLTPQGQDAHWLSPTGDALSMLPSLASFGQPQQPKTLAVVLATAQSGGQSVPIVSYQPYGTGRVVSIEGCGAWRWAFMPPQFEAHQEIYARMWQSLLRWLVSSVGLPPGQNVALATDRVSFSTSDTASATLLLRDETAEQVPSVELFSAGKLVQTVAPAALGEVPGVYRVVFGKLAEGSYEAAVAGAAKDQPASRTLFDVRTGGQEDLDLQARPDLMARIASESGGAALQSDSAAEVGRLFGEHLVRSRPDRVERKTAWDRPWVLVSILLLWTTAWAVRRSSGLT